MSADAAGTAATAPHDPPARSAVDQVVGKPTIVGVPAQDQSTDVAKAFNYQYSIASAWWQQWYRWFHARSSGGATPGPHFEPLSAVPAHAQQHTQQPDTARSSLDEVSVRASPAPAPAQDSANAARPAAKPTAGADGDGEQASVAKRQRSAPAAMAAGVAAGHAVAAQGVATSLHMGTPVAASSSMRPGGSTPYMQYMPQSVQGWHHGMPVMYVPWGGSGAARTPGPSAADLLRGTANGANAGAHTVDGSKRRRHSMSAARAMAAPAQRSLDGSAGAARRPGVLRCSAEVARHRGTPPRPPRSNSLPPLPPLSHHGPPSRRASPDPLMQQLQDTRDEDDDVVGMDLDAPDAPAATAAGGGKVGCQRCGSAVLSGDDGMSPAEPEPPAQGGGDRAIALGVPSDDVEDDALHDILMQAAQVVGVHDDDAQMLGMPTSLRLFGEAADAAAAPELAAKPEAAEAAMECGALATVPPVLGHPVPEPHDEPAAAGQAAAAAPGTEHARCVVTCAGADAGRSVAGNAAGTAAHATCTDAPAATSAADAGVTAPAKQSPSLVAMAADKPNVAGGHGSSCKEQASMEDSAAEMPTQVAAVNSGRPVRGTRKRLVTAAKV